MKKSFFLIFVNTVLIVCIGLYSCVNENVEQVEYQEDIDDYDRWFFSNQHDLEDINRDELIQLDAYRGKAIYRNITFEKRYELWKDKFQNVLNSYEQNSPEYLHISKLATFIHPELFDEETDNQNLVYEFSQPWTEYAQHTLGWTNINISILLESLFTPEEFAQLSKEKGAVKKVAPDQGNIGSVGPVAKKCICSWDVWCFVASGMEYWYCDNTSCARTSKGCGVLYQFPCLEICSD